MHETSHALNLIVGVVFIIEMADDQAKTATTERNVKLSFFGAKGEPREIVGGETQTLEAAIKEVVPDFSASNLVLNAEVKGHPEPAVVHPLLLCGWLKHDGHVEVSKPKEKSLLTEDRESVSSAINEQTLFFVKTTDRYAEKAITHSHYSVYEGKDLCVTAEKGDSLLKSLKKDGRFLNLEKWKMFYKKIRTSPSLNAKAKDFSNEIFTVSVNHKRTINGVDETPQDCKKRRATQRNASNDASSEDVGVADSPVPSVEDCLTAEIVKGRIGIVKSNAYSTLLKPAKERQEGDKRLGIVAQKIAKKIPRARPARLLRPLSKHMRSVGCLVCGEVEATCFLISSNIVITSFHAYLAINNARKNGKKSDWKKIKVFFDYLDPESECLGEEEVHEGSKFPRPRIYNAKLGYVCFRLRKSSSLEKRVPLGQYVRNQALGDVKGLVAIIGHPLGLEKLEEMCAVVPHYSLRDQPLGGFQETRPDSLAIDKFYHVVKADIMPENYEPRSPYDTCFLLGSSGSPVFNMHGDIIAMHAQGYTLEENGITTGLMQFAVSFSAIFEDIRKGHTLEIAAKLFPRIQPL